MKFDQRKLGSAVPRFGVTVLALYWICRRDFIRTTTSS